MISKVYSLFFIYKLLFLSIKYLECIINIHIKYFIHEHFTHIKPQQEYKNNLKFNKQSLFVYYLFKMHRLRYHINLVIAESNGIIDLPH